jgi:hypothetical protein
MSYCLDNFLKSVKYLRTVVRYWFRSYVLQTRVYKSKCSSVTNVILRNANNKRRGKFVTVFAIKTLSEVVEYLVSFLTSATCEGE